MLDEVLETEEIVTIWQEYYRVVDWTVSCAQKMGRYSTGNKAEGLDLPSSDNDFMFNINNVYNIRVV